jgi:hypothetical protein
MDIIMNQKYMKMFRSKRMNILNCFIIYGMCLFLLTACETNKQSEISYEEPVNRKTPDLTIVSSDIIQENKLPDDNAHEIPAKSLIISHGKTIIERFGVPSGFTRVKSEEESFGDYLQNLPLKPDGTRVKYYDGREKLKDVYLAVVDFSLGDRDLQQCADGVIRLKAEYLYAMKRYDEIHFNFVSGFNAEFSKWADGNSISVKGNKVSWNSNSNNNDSYESFQKYLDMVYAYASTLSLEKELIEKEFSKLAIGDVFIQGGSPGHCVIVVDMAVNKNTGEKLFMLAQSYMPAQDIQILIGDREDSPWFSSNIEDTLKTPEWTFQVFDLKTWK